MGAPKGRPKPKNSGTKKGQKLKKTLEWEEFGRRVIEGNLDKIEAYISTLDGEKQYEAVLKLFEYFKPKLSRSDINQNNTGTLIVINKNVTDARSNNRS